MPTKGPGSHVLSAVVALFASSTLSNYVSELLPPVEEVSRAVLVYVDALPVVTLPTDSNAAGALIVILGVTVLWEIAHVARKS
jgi:hypothetical protein